MHSKASTEKMLRGNKTHASVAQRLERCAHKYRFMRFDAHHAQVIVNRRGRGFKGRLFPAASAPADSKGVCSRCFRTSGQQGSLFPMLTLAQKAGIAKSGKSHLEIPPEAWLILQLPEP